MIEAQDFGRMKTLNNEGTHNKLTQKRPKMGILKHKDNSFREFRRLCKDIANESSYTGKTEAVANFLSKGSDGKKFHGDLYIWVKMLLPGVSNRVYHLQDKQLVKIFSRILGCSQADMMDDLEAGDIAETIAKFFDQSKKIQACKRSNLTIHDVDEFLDRMEALTKEADQEEELFKIVRRCTVNDLKMIIRLIKADLKMRAGPKHVLDGVNKDAYKAFNRNRNLDAVLDNIFKQRSEADNNPSMAISPLHPIEPMLAIAIKTVDEAFERCPNGMFAEVKYDGERVQLHKKGQEFKFFSRNLKPVLPHKVETFKDLIPKAFPGGCDMILDGEVLLIDNKTGNPLPFGTLGIHKAADFEFATPCIFVFDCLFYNGKSLIDQPLTERRAHLANKMEEVGNSIKFSETTTIKKKEQLENLIQSVFEKGLEGLILKDINGIFEPGKRHWLKVKKDHLDDGAMADSADLSVLGAWYGTGIKGGKLAVFLMGCCDKASEKWYTVTKVAMGIDDDTLNELQSELVTQMIKIKRDHNKIPDWLNCNRRMTPDFVAKDPKKAQVWEITGAEFTKSDKHTADGISIRFPRITRFRPDKDWKTATDLQHLKALYKASKET